MLTENTSWREVGANIGAASNTDSNSDIIDMTGWDGVVFACAIEDSANTGVAHLKAEANTANSDTGMAAITSGDATATSAADDDLNGKLLVIDVYKPTKRYVQAVRTSGTANIAFGSLIAVLYRGRKFPVSEHSTIADLAAVAGG